MAQVKQGLTSTDITIEALTLLADIEWGAGRMKRAHACMALIEGLEARSIRMVRNRA